MTLEEPDIELDELDDGELLEPPGTWSDEEREQLCLCDNDFALANECPVHGDDEADAPTSKRPLPPVEWPDGYGE